VVSAKAKQGISKAAVTAGQRTAANQWQKNID
jgi:hypothetical protein